MHLTEICQEAHKIAKSKGWHNPEAGWERMAINIVSEVAEAHEAWREGDDEHIGEELADIIIRVADTAQAMDIDLEGAVLAKMALNRARPQRHGGKRS